jgi:hypothetical protein
MVVKRNFTIQASEIGFKGGVYKSDLPSKAAKKAAKRLFELVEKNEEYKKYNNLTEIKFILRESTKGSTKKTFFYEAEKKNLSEPKIVKVKAPNNPKADSEGYLQYEVTKKIKVTAFAENHRSFHKLFDDLTS